jgi:hypothetical protein
LDMTADHNSHRILDCTCGGRSIWTDGNKHRDDTVYTDMRQEPPGFYGHEGRTYAVQPDVLADYRRLPFAADTFELAVYDPPHITRADGMQQLSGHILKKYGALHAETWQQDLHDAVTELFRVLTDQGTLVFKFADATQDWTDVIAQLPVDPLFGTTTKKIANQETRWFTLHASQWEDSHD